MVKPKRRRRRRRGPVGAVPGLLTVDPEAPAPELRAIAYGPTKLFEVAVADLASLEVLRTEHSVVWLDVVGLGDAERIAAVGKVFELHPLALEDVVHTHQRPKVEEYGDHCFLVLRLPRRAAELTTEQVSLFLGDGWVVTFREGGRDPLGGRDPRR